MAPARLLCKPVQWHLTDRVRPINMVCVVVLTVFYGIYLPIISRFNWHKSAHNAHIPRDVSINRFEIMYSFVAPKWDTKERDNLGPGIRCPMQLPIKGGNGLSQICLIKLGGAFYHQKLIKISGISTDTVISLYPIQPCDRLHVSEECNYFILNHFVCRREALSINSWIGFNNIICF